MHLYVIAANSYSSFYVSVYVFCTKLGAFLLFFFIYKSFVWCAAAKWTRIKAATLPVFKALMPLDFDKKHYYCLRILNKTILMTYFFSFHWNLQSNMWRHLAEFIEIWSQSWTFSVWLMWENNFFSANK